MVDNEFILLHTLPIKAPIIIMINLQVLDLLKEGGAEHMKYFSEYVTHLICGDEAEETDITDANDLYEIPALTIKWIYMCCKLKRLVNTKPYLYNTTKLFSNLTFTFSEIREDKVILWALITYNGGSVQTNLTNKSTHLITGSTSSSKYLKAQSLGPDIIKIVTPDWVVQSIKNGSLADSELFQPRLILWPKSVKHESTTSITGFEPEPSESPQNQEESSEDSTQALLAKLKQRMPWNQPQMDAMPPNVVAPPSRLPASLGGNVTNVTSQQGKIYIGNLCTKLLLL